MPIAPLNAGLTYGVPRTVGLIVKLAPLSGVGSSGLTALPSGAGVIDGLTLLVMARMYVAFHPRRLAVLVRDSKS